jgi:hypothetical protein
MLVGFRKYVVWIQLTALVGSALGVSILGSAVTSKGNRHKGQEGESGEAHYDYD